MPGNFRPDAVPSHQFLREYLQLHGYWVLFIWTFLEGEAGLVLAGFFAYQGYFTLPGIIATSCVGAFCGDQFYFYLGRLKGNFLVGHSHILARKFRKALRLIEKYGTFVAFVSRYTYGFRIVLPIILGMTTFPSRKFFQLNAVSALAWASIFSLVGYFFGAGASLVVKDVGRYEQYLILILAGCIASFWLSHIGVAWWRRGPARARLRRMKERRDHESFR